MRRWCCENGQCRKPVWSLTRFTPPDPAQEQLLLELALPRSPDTKKFLHRLIRLKGCSAKKEPHSPPDKPSLARTHTAYETHHAVAVHVHFCDESRSHLHQPSQSQTKLTSGNLMLHSGYRLDFLCADDAVSVPIKLHERIAKALSQRQPNNISKHTCTSSFATSFNCSCDEQYGMRRDIGSVHLLVQQRAGFPQNTVDRRRPGRTEKRHAGHLRLTSSVSMSECSRTRYERISNHQTGPLGLL